MKHGIARKPWRRRSLAATMSRSRIAANRIAGIADPIWPTARESSDVDARYRITRWMIVFNQIVPRIHAGTNNFDRAIVLANACPDRCVVFEDGNAIHDNGKQTTT